MVRNGDDDPLFKIVDPLYITGQNFKNIINTIAEKETFKLVPQLGKWKKNVSLILSFYFFHIFSKNGAFSFYIFRTYHFDNKIIVSLSIAFHSIQHLLSVISDFLLLKFQISTKNVQCFRINISTLITPE